MSLETIFSSSRPAFIPYGMAGDPDLETTELIARALTRCGAAAIELGVPYGDPLADGPTIAAAGLRALRNGVRVTDVLELAARLHRDGCPPIVLFSYFNPILQYGLERFARDAAQAGIAGAIVPDVALEETSELGNALSASGIDFPLLVAPSTSRERAARICDQSTGFVYVVSRLGVTGAGSGPDFAALRAQIAMLREVTSKPLAVGFGVSTAAHVREVAPLADGIVVASALIDAYAGSRGEEAASRVEVYAKQLFS
jgi:tryptophan synthase alpha chain